MDAVRQSESTMWTNTFLFIDISNLNHNYKLSQKMKYSWSTLGTNPKPNFYLFNLLTISDVLKLSLSAAKQVKVTLFLFIRSTKLPVCSVSAVSHCWLGGRVADSVRQQWGGFSSWKLIWLSWNKAWKLFKAYCDIWNCPFIVSK